MKFVFSILFIVFTLISSVVAQNYSNPVINSNLPDPTIIQGEDGYFYLYATEGMRNMPIYRSKDLVNWTFGRTVFTDTTRPTFEPNGNLWAPDINYINGKYVLYYSMSVWGQEETCGIGIAIADSPKGPFLDQGKLFRSNEIGVTNSIDPFYIEDNGTKYLFWGSFRGLYYIEMSDDGLALKYPDSPQPIKVAGSAFEATSIHKRGDYYYFFASIGSCCNGINSTYKLVVGRSSSITGPYLNKSGKTMISNNYSLVIGSNERFVGNGHCSEIVQDDAGNDWIFFHGWDVNNMDKGRVLLINQIKWDDQEWPYVENFKSPSLTAPKPVFGSTGFNDVNTASCEIKTIGNTVNIETQSLATVKVHAINGVLVKSFKKNMYFQFSLASGCYIVNVKTKNDVMMEKIIVN